MTLRIKLFYIALASILLVSLNAPPVGTRGGPFATSDEVFLSSTRLEQEATQNALSYPTDPAADIPWSAGTGGVADIQAAFNHGRAVENSQLGTSIPAMTLPSQAEWNAMTDGQKALWLINRERIDRGVPPLDGLETNVGGVAQYYANYLLNNNAWGHTADGRDPWQRLDDNPAIGACHDFLSIAENLAVFVTSGSSIALPIERSIYMWMYEDGSCCGWGHRHAVLWYPYNDNSGQAGREGFLGIGRANGGPYKGPFSQSWPFAEIIVMNVFDPCPSWSYSVPGAATLVSPNGSTTGTTPTYTWNKVNTSTWYYLWVNNAAGTAVTQQWYMASQVCGSGSTCSVTPGVALPVGNYAWWIQTWNDAGYGPWSAGSSFQAIRPPGAATLVSPSGTISTPSPAYTWNHLSGATWYYLWVNKADGTPAFQPTWYRASQVCGSTTCSVTPAGITLNSGNYTWWIQTWNDGGYGPWSNGKPFTVQTMPPPGAATLVSPGGSITDTTPTYLWNKVNASTWYHLWVSRVNSDGSLTTVHSQWYQSSAACGNTTCSITPAGVSLSGGSYRWWIQTWNDGGYGPWSAKLDFSLP